MPLKIISRKMNYKIIPISWKNRKRGKAKFNIKELIHPKIGVTYLRYYYLSPIGRITVDKNIFFQKVNNYLKFSNGNIRDNKTILELKIEREEKQKFDKN